MLVTENLCKTIDEFSLKNISIHIEPGYIYGFVGKNGSGKTTTISLLLGAMASDSGKITYFNNKDIVEAKQNIGFVYEDFTYYEHLSGYSMAGILSKFYGQWDMTKFENFCSRFKIPLKKKIETYSKGMKLKYSLACALSYDPQLLILDEPTSGIDPVFRNELMEIFQRYVEDGEKSIFFSSHITSDLEKLADYIYFIDQGRIILESTSDRLKEDFLLVKGPKEALLRLEKGAIGMQHMKYNSQCLIRNQRQVKNLIDASCITTSPTFEEILVHLTKGEDYETIII